MFEFLRQMSVPEVSAVILRWMFYLAKYFGVLCIRFKRTTDNQVAVEESGAWWKWSLAILRVAGICVLTFKYFVFIIRLNDLLRKFVHIIQVLLNIACCLSLLRLHLVQGTDCTNLVNRFIQLFLRVERLSMRKRKGFGGKHELVILILTLSGMFYDVALRIHLYPIKKYELVEIYMIICNKILMPIAFVGYMALGLLYADLNDYVCTKFRSELESLEERPTRWNLRKARKSLDMCLTLYKEVISLTTLFQKIFNLLLLISLAQNCINVALISYSSFIIFDISLPWLLSKISFEILYILLLTLSVERTKLQFGTIRRLVLENCHLSEDEEWHKTLEVFFTHINLYEFRVRPLGLLEISNEILMDFLSALITYLTIVIQYGMQLEILSLSFLNRLN